MTPGAFILHASVPIPGYDDPAPATLVIEAHMCQLLASPHGIHALAAIQANMVRYLFTTHPDIADVTWWCEPIRYPETP